jgi:putative aminopeptidase FrvX
MPFLPSLDLPYLRDTLTRLLLTPSPVGDTEAGVALCRDLLCDIAPVEVRTTRKGALVATWKGCSELPPRAVTAHIDTLGAVVRGIKPNGRLLMAPLGGVSWGPMENEGATLRTESGREWRGSIVLSNTSRHIYSSGDGPRSVPRDEETMEFRLDARTTSEEETRSLGVEVGDFIIFDPRPEWNEGFIRSRFLDDKACVAALLCAVKAVCDAGLRPERTLVIHIPNYEEVGHGGASGIPPEVEEVLTLDIAPIGTGQHSDEYSCSICARDADGPYDRKMRRDLVRLAREHDIALKVDTYPEYCSDGDALWKAGGDARVALIGPGVDATHGYERTHEEAIIATAQMVVAWLLSG